jgi:hypothetical protein
VAAKCNIAKLALNKANKLLWGLSCSANNNAIVENYIEYLDCSIDQKICYQGDDCTNDPIILNCSLIVTGISFQIVGSETVDILFNLAVGNIYGAKNPLIYKWHYDTDVFDLVGNDSSFNVQLKLKPGKNINLITTAISVDITDANGCKDSKQCYYTPSGIQCADSFVPCLGVTGLESNFIYVECKKPKNLVVV